jgi:tight adherence protein C
MMIYLASAAVLLAVGGMVCLWQAVAPTSRPLDRRLEAVYSAPAVPSTRWRRRWQRAALQALGWTAGDRRTLDQNLAICEDTVEHHAMVKLGFAVGGVALPVGFWFVWQLAGIQLSLSAVALLSSLLCVIGFVYPDLSVRAKAERMRREFRYALSLFLDLVVITTAGGSGVHEALRKSARIGEGLAFQEIRRALTTAFLEAESPWRALLALGERVGSSELVEVASSVELAVNKGAPPQESLRAKASGLRDRELADMKAEAVAASERMGGPMVAMFAGLIILVGYPAVAQILGM